MLILKHHLIQKVVRTKDDYIWSKCWRIIDTVLKCISHGSKTWVDNQIDLKSPHAWALGNTLGSAFDSENRFKCSTGKTLG